MFPGQEVQGCPDELEMVALRNYGVPLRRLLVEM